MAFLSKSRQVSWTHHARAKMAFYGLSEQRVLRVLHAPRRTEEGVAPKTVAVMQPVSVRTARAEAAPGDASNRGRAQGKRTSFRSRPIPHSGDPAASGKEIWSQEIWVMIQDLGNQRKIVSAWRYPGMTKPRSELARDVLRREYREFLRENK